MIHGSRRERNRPILRVPGSTDATTKTCERRRTRRISPVLLGRSSRLFQDRNEWSERGPRSPIGDLGTNRVEDHGSNRRGGLDGETDENTPISPRSSLGADVLQIERYRRGPRTERPRGRGEHDRDRTWRVRRRGRKMGVLVEHDVESDHLTGTVAHPVSSTGSRELSGPRRPTIRQLHSGRASDDDLLAPGPDLDPLYH